VGPLDGPEAGNPSAGGPDLVVVLLGTVESHGKLCPVMIHDWRQP